MGMAMTVAVRTLIRSGAETSLLEDFRALAEATTGLGEARYRERPCLDDLALFLVRGSSGANRDAALYELCHLVNAVDAAGTARDRRNLFFLGPEAATPARFRARFTEALSAGGWRRPGFALDQDGVRIRYKDAAFAVRFSRMPFLAALYEFLSGMEDFGFYAEFQTVLDGIAAASADLKAVQSASNRLASRLRQYRRVHVQINRQDAKCDALLAFIAGRSPAGRLQIDDDTVLDFWRSHATVGDFRAYRTAFEAVVTLIQALAETSGAEALAQALPIGTDRALGEVEPAHDASAAEEGAGPWRSPLPLLDEPPADAIKFFKKESERKPLEGLMRYGPIARELPLAFLRLEAFGPVQSAITTDLQVGRPMARIARIGCEAAEDYRQILARFDALSALVVRLQKAALYALHTQSADLERPDHEPRRPGVEAALDDAARVFRSIARKGFEPAELADEGRRDGFRIGAEVLVTVRRQIEAYLAAARPRGGSEANLEALFAADRAIFSAVFERLYGAIS